MSDIANLISLHNRLSTQQRALLMQAADAETLPASGALAQIANLESALTALDNLIEEATPASDRRPAAKERSAVAR